MKSNFLERLKNDEVILFDGATGTMLYSKGIFFNKCFDEINISNPKLVKGIHRDYVLAGADIITTNTFGATRPRLEEFGFAEKIEEINRRGVMIVKEVLRETNHENDVYIAGCIGPLGKKLEPLGQMSCKEAKGFFKEQAEYLYDAGVDIFSLETFVDLNELKQAIEAVKEVASIPVVASITVNNDGTSIYGTEPKVYTSMIDKWGADVIGLNCSDGPKSMVDAVEEMITATDKPICLQPNAGIPKNVDGRNIYLSTPEYMSEYAKRFILKGVNIVGGCCGTTPAHTKEMRNAVRALRPGKKVHKKVEVNDDDKSVDPLPIEERSLWGKKLKNGDFVITVELLPPKGFNMTKVLKSSQKLKDRGIDAINIPDGPRASSRMSAMATAVIIQREIGIDAVLHYTCRDRNLLGMQSDLLGTAALGINNLLLVTGDPPKMGGYVDATAVFDIDSVGLCNLVDSLNHGYDLGKNFIGTSINACYGVGVNPGAIDLEYELKRYRWKLDAGAEFAITQPVFDVNILFEFLDKIKDYPRIPIIAGIWPLISYRNAEFMNNEVPGASVPEKIMERMMSCKTKEEGRDEGIKIAKEIYNTVKDKVDGVQLSAPFGNVDFALRILD